MSGIWQFAMPSPDAYWSCRVRGKIGRREQSGAPILAQTELVEQSLKALAAPT
jgi:hypothetical protein